MSARWRANPIHRGASSTQARGKAADWGCNHRFIIARIGTGQASRAYRDARSRFHASLSAARARDTRACSGAGSQSLSPGIPGPDHRRLDRCRARAGGRGESACSPDGGLFGGSRSGCSAARAASISAACVKKSASATASAVESESCSRMRPPAPSAKQRTIAVPP
jgi:hypothetical protein